MYNNNYYFHHPASDRNSPNHPNKWTIQHQQNIYKNRLIQKFNHQDWEECLNRSLAAENPDTPVSILQKLVTDNNKSYLLARKIRDRN